MMTNDDEGGRAETPGSGGAMPLGRLHRWWLREFGGNTKLMVGDGYAGTPYARALIGLMNRGLVKFVAGFEGAGLVELTAEGMEARDSGRCCGDVAANLEGRDGDDREGMGNDHE